MKQQHWKSHKQQQELSWWRKWLNIPTSNSDYSADSDSGYDSDSDSDSEQEFCDALKESRFKNDKPDEIQVDAHANANRSFLGRRKSETFRAQYINNKEIKVCAATWNVGGEIPTDDLDIDGWLDVDEHADIYVIGPLESDGDVKGTNIVCTDASFFKDNDTFGKPVKQELERQFSSPKRQDRLSCLKEDDSEEKVAASNEQFINKLTKTFNGTERIGLCWPEPPLHLLGQQVLEKPNSFGSSKSFKTSKLFRTYSSFKSALAEIDLESLINRKRRPPYVRIVSKQMVGIFITIWVRKSLRRYIQNMDVSTVGVGVMGYIGNKGSISVSMSIHQTLFCFVCTHLTSGERDADAVKRNADVHEIQKRTRFNFHSAVGLPRRIYDHERIIWLGDLNYRINLSCERTRELISTEDWSKLVERDQLIKGLKKGRAFDGWSEGGLSFAPTYKFELNSETYFGEDPRAGRRTPAWCDRVLSYRTGMKLQSYRRSEVKLFDHRPVTASYMVEVEVFSPKKLQRALTFTDAEIEEHDIVRHRIW